MEIGKRFNYSVCLGVLIKKGVSMEKEEKIALKKKQFDMAMKGNVPMLIWLGKQYLGQMDKQEVEHFRPIEEIEFDGI